MRRIAIIAIAFLAFCGLADAFYLASSEINDIPLQCAVQTLSDCNIVAQSPYASFLGIKIAEYGVAFYIVVFVLAAIELVIPSRAVRRMIQIIAAAGVAVSAYLTYIEFAVIKALCIYCLVSAGIALAIGLFALVIEPIKRTTRIVN